jgi:multidrug efflux pump subunit AcrA (membrane-fusion protein)
MASWKAARSAKFYLFSILAMVAAGWGVFYLHSARNQDIAAVREAKAVVADLGPRVEVVATTAGPKERTIKLLGDVRSGASTSLYGKVSGYMKTMHVDKGDKVEAGQVVAEIESPELEQAYAAASADLSNKQRNLARIRGLYEKGNATQVACAGRDESTVAEQCRGAGDDQGLPDRACALPGPCDRALHGPWHARHQCADQFRQRHADADDLR